MTTDELTQRKIARKKKYKDRHALAISLGSAVTDLAAQYGSGNLTLERGVTSFAIGAVVFILVKGFGAYFAMKARQEEEADAALLDTRETEVQDAPDSQSRR